ncbi:MAG TPA: phosphatase PAP2 family protein [Saprospiraceae bacterium]|nr:phosphatase PAP2 family protein [Saprospiraceae bacterium]
MKKILLSIVVTITTLAAMAQTDKQHQTANYEAANWKTWLLDNPEKIMLSPPPSLNQTKAELKSVRQAIENVDEKQLAEIKYWNAGAPAYRWNQITPELIGQSPGTMLRIPTAWVNIAIYDATIIAWKEKIKYKRARPNEIDAALKPVINVPLTYSYPCEHSVTAAAAANVLAYFFPEKADSIMQLAHAASQSRIDAGVQFPSDVAAGWEIGEQVAKEIIEKAKNDGSAGVWDGTMNTDPKKWKGAYPVGITLASFMPVVLNSPDQFRPAAPPDFKDDMKELKEFEQTFASSSSAYYWANHGGFDYWSDVAALKMFEYRMSDDAPAVARIYAVLHTAFHDAAIAIMDAKYTYWGIRPDQYDTTYAPLISTPPFPGYPSGHAAGAATTSAVLAYFFPADAQEFRELAQECADSRFYGGIHFRTDNETGLRMGEALGKYIVERWMKEEE